MCNCDYKEYYSYRTLVKFMYFIAFVSVVCISILWGTGFGMQNDSVHILIQAIYIIDLIILAEEFFYFFWFMNDYLTGKADDKTSCIARCCGCCCCFFLLFLKIILHILRVIYLVVFSILHLVDCTRCIKNKNLMAYNIGKFIFNTIIYLFVIICYLVVIVKRSYFVKTDQFGIFGLACAHLTLCVFRYIRIVGVFIRNDLYVPDDIRKMTDPLDPRTKRFMRISEYGSGFCVSGNQCMSVDLEHIVRCHDILHLPTRRCNCAYLCDKQGCYIGFHQTAPSAACGISQTGFRPGTEGMFGGGIYFARTCAETMQKAHYAEALIVAIVDMGKMKKVNHSERNTTLMTLLREGCDSVYAVSSEKFLKTGDEMVVYEPHRVKEWIIVYPDGEFLSKVETIKIK